MKLYRYLSCLILTLCIVLSSFDIMTVDSFAAPKRSKAKTSAVAKKKRSTSKKTSSSKNSKRKSTSKKRSTKGKNNRRKETAPPQEMPQNDELTLLVNDEVIKWVPIQMNPGGLRVNNVKPDAISKTAKISLNENFTYLPVTKELINDMKKHITRILPDSISDYELNLMVGEKGYAYFINVIDKLPENQRKGTSFVVEAEPWVKPRHGMVGDIVALWASHGRYFKPGAGSWQWQRPQLFQVTEDTHTMSYILPYVVPMIENAGGYVLLPRERDINRNEVIVDNDSNEAGEIFSQPYYKEFTGSQKWTTGEEEGFIYDLPDFRDTENPFENGTYRQTKTIKNGKQSLAAWFADIPEDGEYAVYVSYKTLPNSSEDAHYKVNYSGGSKEFIVNQTMGGGTWVYLGTFPFEEGYDDEEPVVVLSNLSSTEGKLITADAVKIGGGMGNISRSNSRSDIYVDPSTPIANNVNNYSEDTLDENDEADEDDESTPSDFDNLQAINELTTTTGYKPYFSTSGLPRFLEGARYWLQWAGMPEQVYSPYSGTDDYKDDYTSRGLWVNYLAGGSRVLPGRKGLNIPIDVCMALHSDAGKRNDDTFIGTLGIYFTNDGDYYADGTPRTNSRALTDLLMRQITTDIRQLWEPNWTRRSMWDKSYVEARVPEVPTSLIEFMSHQNFAEMRYALDPAFRFTVGRSIYKALGRFVAERKDKKFIVQPLPVKNFMISKEKKGTYRLSWQPTPDPLEPTAEPQNYIILERTADDLGFHKIGETSSTSFNIKISDDLIHSFRIVAANEGGISFPSETLALREGKNDSKPILIINGFTRISGPENYAYTDEAGFNAESDFGVPYINDISFMGYQTEFRRKAGESFGRSGGNYASTVIAGNTFDYPYIHGVALEANGKSFISASAGAVENGEVNLESFNIIDLILGKQKATITGNGFSGTRFEAFPEKLRTRLEDFLSNGGSLFVSGQYVASDLLDYMATSSDREFATRFLGIDKADGQRPMTGSLNVVPDGKSGFSKGNFSFNNSLNNKCYIVENPDILIPSELSDSKVFLRFSDTGNAAGILSTNGKNRNVVMSVPFETIQGEGRNRLMGEILNFLEKK